MSPPPSVAVVDQRVLRMNPFAAGEIDKIVSAVIPRMANRRENDITRLIDAHAPQNCKIVRWHDKSQLTWQQGNGGMYASI